MFSFLLLLELAEAEAVALGLVVTNIVTNTIKQLTTTKVLQACVSLSLAQHVLVMPEIL